MFFFTSTGAFMGFDLSTRRGPFFCWFLLRFLFLHFNFILPKKTAVVFYFSLENPPPPHPTHPTHPQHPQFFFLFYCVSKCSTASTVLVGTVCFFFFSISSFFFFWPGGGWWVFAFPGHLFGRRSAQMGGRPSFFARRRICFDLSSQRPFENPVTPSKT